MKKILSFILTLAVILTSFAGINMFSVSAATVDDIFTAAEEYVKTNENAVTADGLLAAVQAVDANVTLDVANDFYIKYAVPGVKDVMADGSTNEYPLNIEGSDGAVAAIFGYNGARYGFTCGFAHEVETIEINEVAVVGESAGFTYSENQTFTESGVSYTYEKLVTGYSGTADKIVIPEGFKGTFSGTTYNSSQPIRYGSVEVLIVNNTEPLYKNGFEGWSSLKAVQFAERTTEDDWILYSNPNAGTGRVFCHCHELKYVKLPSIVLRPWEDAPIFPQMMFCQCWELENVNLPTSTSTKPSVMNWRLFDGTKVKEFNLPQYYTYSSGNCVFNNSSYGSLATYGKQRVNLYTDDMTNIRAVALAMAEANELMRADATGEQLVAGMKSAITGSHNAADVANAISITTEGAVSNDLYEGIAISIAAGNDNMTLSLEKSKGLSSLNTDYGIEPVFNPSILNYTVSVAAFVDKVTVDAVAVDGAVVGEIFESDGVITVPVTTSEGKTVNYTITIVKVKVLDESVYTVADSYVQEKGNAVTVDGLIAAVNTIWADATIAESDFYVKHAVNAVVDDDDVSGYQLSIEGSKGSVTAVIEYQGARYTFNTVFDYQTEVIDIDSYAIVGDEAYAEYFTYDEAGNVTAILKPVEKLIFPVGFAGTMKKLGDESLINADRVKVVIYNNGVAFLSGAFSGWQGLRAVKIDNGDTSFNLASAVNNKREDHMFSYCPNLKYFQFPNKICNAYYWNTMFPNSFLEGCSNLETVIMAKEATSGGPYTQYGFRIFYGTKVQELLMPNYRVAVALGQETFDSSTVQEGTRNIHYYTDEMTYVRAVSLIAAGFNVDSNNVIDDAKALIAGTNDSAQYADTLDYIWKESTENDYITEGNLSVSNGIDYAYIDAKLSKTLAKLTVEKYALDLDFDSEKSEYTVIAPYLETALNISAIAVGGATVTSTDGNIVDNCAEIIVTNTDGKTVAYKINVKREGDINAELISALRKNLLNIEVCPYLDLNSDTYFDIRDLVRAKKMAATPFSNNSENIPVIASTLNGNTETELASVLSYESNNGQITDTLFDGVAFRPTTDWMYIYPEGGAQIRNTTKREWSSFLYNNILQDDYNLPAFEKAAGNLKQTLGMPEYKAAVYLPLMITRDGFDSWGEIDGVALDFTNSADRIAALKWLVDESIAAFDAKGFVNVELCGFYYIDEAMREGDMDILPTVTEYVRSKGLKTFWAPYSDANGTRPSDEYLWDDYGFDEATYQINYFPGRMDLPAARDESYIKYIGENASAHGANIEMELCGRTKENISGLKAYLKGGIDYGYMNGDFISWWISSDCKTVEYLRDSDDAYIRSTYDEMYKFIKKTLTEKEINTVMGD